MLLVSRMRYVIAALSLIISIAVACNSPEKSAKRIEEKKLSNITPEEIAKGKALFDREDCGGCHSEVSAITGPSFQHLAGEYVMNEGNISHLANKAIEGVKATEAFWGSREMPAHPNLKREDAEAIVKYMLSFPADPDKPYLHNRK